MFAPAESGVGGNGGRQLNPREEGRTISCPYFLLEDSTSSWK